MATVSEPQPDRIEIRGLRLLGTHGVLAEERTRPQPFEVDADLVVSMVDAGSSDDLADTVDYAAVVDRIAAVVGGATSFMLLEALAQAAADEVLAVDSRVQAVTLSVRKRQPPLPADLSTVGVRITRSR
ncbi:MAG TPA: dihydroneopterin aldolase [Acidimicrobiales bacterium]|nr:dihydroneopterin aldolase [Acidimicrobiales bacterium]